MEECTLVYECNMCIISMSEAFGRCKILGDFVDQTTRPPLCKLGDGGKAGRHLSKKFWRWPGNMPAIGEIHAILKYDFLFLRRVFTHVGPR